MLCSWCDTRCCSFFTKFSPLIDPPFWPKVFWTLILQSKRILFHCSIIQSLCDWSHWSLCILVCFFNRGFMTIILPYRPASQSLLLPADFFHYIGSVVQWCWSIQPSAMQAGNLLSFLLRCSTRPHELLFYLANHYTTLGAPAMQAGDSDEIVLCSCCCFRSTIPNFGLVLSFFLMSSNNIIKLSSKEEKCLKIKFSKDIWLY